MIDRIKEKLFSLRSSAKRSEPRRTVLRGNARNVIVVKAPNDIFTEAIFMLRDDYYTSQPLSSAELLRQAREAAYGCAASAAIRDKWKMHLIYILAALLAFETAGLLLII